MITDPIEACRFWLHDDGTIFTDDQIQEFLDLEKVPDEDGNLPSDSEWTPTYDVLRAAGRGWLWLASTSDGKIVSYKAGDVVVTYDKQHCLKRARELLGGSSATAIRRDEKEPGDFLARYR